MLSLIKAWWLKREQSSTKAEEPISITHEPEPDPELERHPVRCLPNGSEFIALAKPPRTNAARKRRKASKEKLAETPPINELNITATAEFVPEGVIIGIKVRASLKDQTGRVITETTLLEPHGICTEDLVLLAIHTTIFDLDLQRHNAVIFLDDQLRYLSAIGGDISDHLPEYLVERAEEQYPAPPHLIYVDKGVHIERLRNKIRLLAGEPENLTEGLVATMIERFRPKGEAA